MEAAVKQKDERFTQPFLPTTRADHNPDQYVLIVDRMAIPCGQQLIKSIDILFKAHYVFNVIYAPLLHQFWEFIASMGYGVIKPCATKPSVRALGSACRDVKLS